jgi:FtsP/CotA-like multicopper oxidase with cupredoxin domain
VLKVSFTYETRLDQFGNRLFCFMSADGAQSPTLHVHPGDELIINLRNNLPQSLGMDAKSMPDMVMGPGSDTCGAMVMTNSSVNIHYHGTNTPPVCHQDEVIKTLINAGQSFRYHLRFPIDEPPGLYWYHPHVHGISEAAVQGGASGVIVVEGIESVNPEVAGLPQRILVFRDNPVPGNPEPSSSVPSWDLSVNYVPVAYPRYVPAVLAMKAGTTEFWRVANASADSFLDLQLRYDGKRQPLQIVSLDGVPVGSQDGTAQGKSFTAHHLQLPPAGRAEFIVNGPAADVQNAILYTLNVDTGPIGDSDPERPLIAIHATPSQPAPSLAKLGMPGAPTGQRFAGLATANVTTKRKLYFSEVLSDPTDPDSPTSFFITVEGQTPMLFDPNNPPAITTTQGSVEDWVIENRTGEVHAFHIHQIHFLLLAKNRVPVRNGQYLDMITVPYWTGEGPYPSVTLRMDFRGPDIGDFVYHCHILEHEDGGMMAIIRVNPR